MYQIVNKYIHIYIHVYMFRCVYTDIYICMCVHMYIYIYIICNIYIYAFKTMTKHGASYCIKSSNSWLMLSCSVPGDDVSVVQHSSGNC